MKKHISNNQGFTLTELIIVVAILGLLAAVATPSLVSYIDQGKAESDAANVKIIENIIQRKLATGALVAGEANSLGTPATVLAEVKTEIGTIPVPRTGAHTGFLYSVTTGRVSLGSAGGVTNDLAHFTDTVATEDT
jgi:prepilin-type N-terminal cleavage/methylation domain-containing protein